MKSRTVTRVIMRLFCEHGVEASKDWVFVAHFIHLFSTTMPMPCTNGHSVAQPISRFFNRRVGISCQAILRSLVRLQNLPWSKTGLVSRQVLHPLSKLQNWIWSKTGRYKTGLVSLTKIEASLRATKPKPWQSNLISDTVEIFIQNEKAGLVPMQSRFRSRHKAGFGAAGLGTAQSWFWSRHKASFGAVSRPV